MKKITVLRIGALIACAASGSSFAASAKPGATVVTINMAKETSASRVLREWNAVPQLREADILLLQEIKEEPGTECIANQLGAALGLHVVYAREEKGVTDRGLAILSRFPLRDVRTSFLPRFDLRFHSRARFALSATAETPWEPVRIENVHLDTRLNSPDRLTQIAPAVRDSERFAGRRIIAGDFNSNPFYWVAHVLPLPSWRSQAGAIDKFMTDRGFRTAISESATTFDYLGMHLDWIWVSGLRSTGSKVLPLDYSDHHAVWTRVQFE